MSKLDNFRMSMYRRGFDIHWLSLFWRFFSFFFLNKIFFLLLSTSSSTKTTTLKHFPSSSIGVIFNGRLTALLATLRNANRRSGALKGKLRTARRQRSMSEGLQGLAFLLESKIYYFYWSHVNNKLCM